MYFQSLQDLTTKTALDVKYWYLLTLQAVSDVAGLNPELNDGDIGRSWLIWNEPIVNLQSLSKVSYQVQQGEDQNNWPRAVTLTSFVSRAPSILSRIMGGYLESSSLVLQEAGSQIDTEKISIVSAIEKIRDLLDDYAESAKMDYNYIKYYIT